MKKISIYISTTVLIFAAFIFGCEEAPLDTSFRKANDGAFETIIVKTNVEPKISPTNDSGLPGVYLTLVGDNVELSSGTDDSQVASRTWLIPQPDAGQAGLEFEEISQLGPVVRSFSRPNNTDNNNERVGFPITLFEKLNDGTINTYTTAIQARNAVSADFLLPDLATINASTSITLLDRASLGLAGSDLRGENQTRFVYTFNKGTSSGATIGGTHVLDSLVIVNNINQAIDVVFTELGEQEITLKITRNYPLLSTAEITKTINVVTGLTPNGGTDRDAIKLSADGSEISVRYTENIGDVSTLAPSTYNVNVEYPSTAAYTPDITVTGIAIDPASPTDIILTLSEPLPLYATSISLDFNGVLFSANGLVIDNLQAAIVVPTGQNYVTAGFDSFEMGWANRFGWDGPQKNIIAISPDRSLLDSNSLLFDIDAAHGGVGAHRLAEPLGPTSNFPGPAEVGYTISFWVYIESTDATAQIGVNLTCVGWVGIDRLVSDYETNKWVLVQGTTTAAAHCGQGAILRPVVRNRNGACKLYMDGLDIRLSDDGR